MRRLTAARFAEIQSDQLDHVRLQEIDVPPRWTLHFGHSARIGREERTGATVDGAVGVGVQRHAGLHRRFTRRHVHNCNHLQKNN